MFCSERANYSKYVLPIRFVVGQLLIVKGEHNFSVATETK